jgi:predicted enzyme related to lactoylglutathione lyase
LIDFLALVTTSRRARHQTAEIRTHFCRRLDAGEIFAVTSEGLDMGNSQRPFTWYELLTTDTAAAKIFYGKIAGWGTQATPNAAVDYTLFTLGATPVAGLMDQPEEAKAMGAPPSWIGYVDVDDVDATTDQAKRLGSSVYVPPTDIPNVGRFAVIADPQGATFALLKWASPGMAQPAEANTPGRVGWHELMAVNWEKAFAFYSELFGWQKGEAVSMGPMGTYQLFSVNGQPIGGMFNKPEILPVPFWLYYINANGIDTATERVKASGGQILNGPMEVPGGSWIVQCSDPQRAMFALVGPKS